MSFTSRAIFGQTSSSQAIFQFEAQKSEENNSNFFCADESNFESSLYSHGNNLEFILKRLLIVIWKNFLDLVHKIPAVSPLLFWLH